MMPDAKNSCVDAVDLLILKIPQLMGSNVLEGIPKQDVKQAT